MVRSRTESGACIACLYPQGLRGYAPIVPLHDADDDTGTIWSETCHRVVTGGIAGASRICLDQRVVATAQ